MREALVDTDTLSYYLRNVPPVVEKLEKYRETSGYLNVSIITHFEILNGLFRKDARKQLDRYRLFAEENVIVNLDKQSVELSAEIISKLHQAGQPIGYLDTLIAGIAIQNDFVLVTNNTGHFSRIENLTIDNWTF
ncbi:type II toxin-antitoxin system VapC family toxin [Telluribacter sp.]|jgi:predicted nucleic acid-binding protein|uniref:type II toxin-antitoxin system VapC family toxin n=1 Tax=Telluribacter sp. TaxID=1978767 RepID=UPI002E0FD607|nr:type II toxin-antitoxin system VapC family toxin [Telluribacter sp.]